MNKLGKRKGMFVIMVILVLLVIATLAWNVYVHDQFSNALIMCLGVALGIGVIVMTLAAIKLKNRLDNLLDICETEGREPVCPNCYEE